MNICFPGETLIFGIRLHEIITFRAEVLVTSVQVGAAAHPGEVSWFEHCDLGKTQIVCRLKHPPEQQRITQNQLFK
jgi:hypothetical protein